MLKLRWASFAPHAHPVSSPGVMPAVALARDLSRYRDFQLGADLPAIAKQLAVNPSEARTVHSRPALIQELEWRPQLPGSSRRTESVRKVAFSFYDGELFRIAITYDTEPIEGMTAADVIEAISETYGHPETPTVPASAAYKDFGDQEEIVARWQDSEYCFNLLRSSYGPGFRLIGELKRLHERVQAAITEAKRLDDREAPQRDAARIAGEKEAERANLERSRLVNKPKFRL